MAVPPGVSNPYYPKPPEPKEAPPKPAKPRVNKNDELINNIVNDMKNNGSFDDLRKICLNHLQNNVSTFFVLENNVSCSIKNRSSLSTDLNAVVLVLGALP